MEANDTNEWMRLKNMYLGLFESNALRCFSCSIVSNLCRPNCVDANSLNQSIYRWVHYPTHNQQVKRRHHMIRYIRVREYGANHESDVGLVVINFLTAVNTTEIGANLMPCIYHSNSVAQIKNIPISTENLHTIIPIVDCARRIVRTIRGCRTRLFTKWPPQWCQISLT